VQRARDKKGRFTGNAGRRPYVPRPRKPRRHVGAPLGIRHGKAEHDFHVVQFVRSLREQDGLKVRHIRQLVPCVRLDTLRDWLYYRTRIVA
jgi:hypothetical protein